MKQNETRHQLTPYTRIISKWIKDLNISHNTIKILEENSKISDILCSNIFANISPRTRGIKEKISQWDYIELKASAWLKKVSSK